MSMAMSIGTCVVVHDVTIYFRPSHHQRVDGKERMSPLLSPAVLCDVEEVRAVPACECAQQRAEVAVGGKRILQNPLCGVIRQ